MANVTQLTFQSAAEEHDFFSALDYRTLPVRGARVLAASGYDDNGEPIITYARQHLADRLTYTLTEQPRRHQVIRIYPVTDAKASALRAALAVADVSGARVRKMRNGACRLVIKSVTDRDAARDALVAVDACTASGRPFTNPDSVHAWNGPVEIFVRFLEA